MSLKARSPESFRRLDAALDRVLDAPEDRREALVDVVIAEQLAGQPELAAELRALVAGLEQRSVLDQPVAELPRAPDPADEDDLPAGTVLGAYRVRERIGAGGMGTVYLGERADGTFERSVAIKVVRRGMDSAEILARFERERAILARLDHPGITHLLDAGALEDGRPYLVMEHVDGVPLREHPMPDLSDRLRLVVGLCEAVAYAHERLVVHRDLKPSNVMVRGDGSPVLLDFGIAKLVAAEAGATQRRDQRLSPRWAAPEQLRGEAVGVRADVYGLGLLLHVVLTGCEHVERDAKGRCPPPSTLAPTGDARRIRGDLDAIAAKALEPDPRHRYPSASALAADLSRHLAGAAVEARSDSLYRFGRFVRVHRLSLSIVAILLGLLVAYAVTVTVQSRALARERDRARRAAERAEQLSGFLETVLIAEHAAAVEGDEPTVREALDRASQRLHDSELPAEVRADLELATARGYYALGRMEDARERAHAAELALREPWPPSVEPLVASLRLQALALAGGYQAPEAREPALQALRLTVGHHGFLHPEVALSLETLAALYVIEQPQRALVAYLAALGLRLLTQGPWAAELAGTLVGLANACTTCEDTSALLRLALAIRRRALGPNHAEVASTLQQLARRTPDRDEARRSFEQALSIERRVLGPRHPWTANTLNDLAMLVEVEDPELAVEYLERALAIVDEAFELGHPRRLLARSNLGAVLRDQGRHPEAEAVLSEALERARTHRPGAITPLAHHLGLTYEALDQPERARATYRLGLRSCGAHEGAPEVIARLATRALALERRASDGEAAQSCRRALACLADTVEGRRVAQALRDEPGCGESFIDFEGLEDSR